jgi:glycosyltransferase involved in cell wall biosynthesis
MSRPLNVLRVITWLPVGGIERKILAVLPRLDPGRFRPRVVCLRERGVLADELESAGVPVDVIPLRSRLSPTGVFRLAAHMRKHEIDIVHSHMYRSNVPATFAARLAGTPVVVCQVHNVDTWESRRQRAMDRFLCRWRDAIIGVSERVRGDVLRNLRVPPDMARVVYNGVDIARFQDRSGRDATRAELGLAAETVVIVYHGRLVEQKNPDALLRVAERIAATRHDVLLLVVGDGPCRARMESEAREKGFAGAVRFLGRRDDIPRLLAASDIAVLPSFKEGFSNALIEALAAGLPVVATDVGGNAEAVETGRSGHIVPSGDMDALLEAVARLTDDADTRRRMGLEAAQRAEFFSLDKMVHNVEGLYEELAGKKLAGEL